MSDAKQTAAPSRQSVQLVQDWLWFSPLGRRLAAHGLKTTSATLHAWLTPRSLSRQTPPPNHSERRVGDE